MNPQMAQVAETTAFGIPSSQKWLLIGGAAAIFLVLLFLSYVVWMNNKREKELIRQVREHARYSHQQESGAPSHGISISAEFLEKAFAALLAVTVLLYLLSQR